MNALTVAGGLAALGGLGLAAGAGLELAALRRRLAAARHAATHDPLTRLRNRAGLAEAWPHLAGRAVALLDLDGFKPVNDQHGHAAGDRVLVTVGARLAARASGLVARLGGDEFAAVLVTADPVGEAWRLAAAVAEPVGLPGGARVAVTASIGVTPPWSGELAGALAAADAAMYRAKTTGATVAVWNPGVDGQPPPAQARPALRVRDLPAEFALAQRPAPRGAR